VLIFLRRERMKSLIGYLLLFGSSVVYGEIIKSRIHSIEGVKATKTHVIKFENGRVAFINDKNLEDMKKYQADFIEAKIDKTSQLLSFKSIETQIRPASEPLLEPTPPAYEPSVVSMEEANKMFNRLNPNYKRKSECSDRAHIWSYEEYTNHQIKTEKVFAFFTATYINNNRLKWWFHVAPLVSVKDGDEVQKMVLDYTFMRRPVKIKEWTDFMVFSKRECKLTNKYSEYDVNPQTEDCYLMIDSMYYKLPLELQNQELQGAYKSSWAHGEVDFSYDFGFKSLLEVQ
jgi:hypothetical protein